MVTESNKSTINYLSFKKEVEYTKVEKVVSTFIQQARRLNKPLWILSFRYKNHEGKWWFKGIQCLPNQLLQDCYWCEQVIPQDHFILDLTSCNNTVTLQGGIKAVANTKFPYNG